MEPLQDESQGPGWLRESLLPLATLQPETLDMHGYTDVMTIFDERCDDYNRLKAFAPDPYPGIETTAAYGRGAEVASTIQKMNSLILEFRDQMNRMTAQVDSELGKFAGAMLKDNRCYKRGDLLCKYAIWQSAANRASSVMKWNS